MIKYILHAKILQTMLKEKPWGKKAEEAVYALYKSNVYVKKEFITDQNGPQIFEGKEMRRVEIYIHFHLSLKNSGKWMKEILVRYTTWFSVKFPYSPILL